MKYHVESLNKKQFSVLQKLAPIIQQKDFYLGGGTALAIYFGHRISVDLDWFTSKQVGASRQRIAYIQPPVHGIQKNFHHRQHFIASLQILRLFSGSSAIY
jgi:Nucleotidyl transferase AbiEii toxin, Type IV TA system